MRQPTPIDWIANKGPQERFLECGAFEALYGGAAGGGKSEALLVGGLRRVDHPYYRGLLLRRTFPDLRRSLLARSRRIYRARGGVFNAVAFEWRFPSGAVIELSSLQRDDDVSKFQSAEYQYIGFDELTTFSAYQYTFMISRLRSAQGIPVRLRGATNPGGIGHDWVLKRFAPWLYPPGHREYLGQRAEAEERLWYAFDEAHTDGEAIVERGTPGASARVFFPAKVADNPFLAGTSYETNLDKLDPLSRARMKHGDWMSRPAAGMFFKRDWLAIVDSPPARPVVRVRFWDRAASTETGADWTAGVLLSCDEMGHWYVEDVVHFQGTPFKVQERIEETAKRDAVRVRRDGIPIWLWLSLDPAQAGRVEAAHYARALARYAPRFAAERGDKITRASVPSAQSEARHVFLVRGEWNERFLAELTSFPEGHDDQVDAFAGAMRIALAIVAQDQGGVTATSLGAGASPASDEEGADAEADDEEMDDPEGREMLAAEQDRDGPEVPSVDDLNLDDFDPTRPQLYRI